MPDISMCRDVECPSRYECYRFMVKPDRFWQSYFCYLRRESGADRCPHFWPMNDGRPAGKEGRDD